MISSVNVFFALLLSRVWDRKRFLREGIKSRCSDGRPAVRVNSANSKVCKIAVPGLRIPRARESRKTEGVEGVPLSTEGLCGNTGTDHLAPG